MVPISSLKEEGDLQSGYLVLDMAEIGTKLDSQSSPTAPPVNAKAPTSCRPANVTAGESAMLEAQVKLGALFLIRFSCVYDSPPGFGAEPQQAVDPPNTNYEPKGQERSVTHPLLESQLQCAVALPLISSPPGKLGSSSGSGSGHRTLNEEEIQVAKLFILDYEYGR
ncbi:hypothetical protein C8J57DRAFT_1251200 [Mycena rebaudengoi]|nr:hypothetical protein C8J57DRAFT_1251200 [Mycena rebaudengoi]